MALNEPARLTPPPEGYADWLAELKGRVHAAQPRATLAVNRELVLLYWQIGRDTLCRSLAGCRNRPTDCWTIALGAQPRAVDPA